MVPDVWRHSKQHPPLQCVCLAVQELPSDPVLFPLALQDQVCCKNAARKVYTLLGSKQSKAPGSSSHCFFSLSQPHIL